MGHNHEIKCSKCGATLYIHEELLLGAPIGCKFHDEVYCPICSNPVYSAFTAGHYIVTVIEQTKEEQ